MNYQYIEQLIDRYFDCDTTIEEEHILCQFFAQDDVPEHLRQWKPLFHAQADLRSAHLDEHFDERILNHIGQNHVKARPITLAQRIYPLYKAAAVVAFAIVVGTAVEHAAGNSDELAAPQMANTGQDELDESEITTTGIKRAEAVDLLSDSLLSPIVIPIPAQDQP